MLPLCDGLPPELAAAGGGRAETRGRYVRIELPGEQRTLTLAEVEVLSNGVNVAPQGTATQSSVAWGGVAQRAVDGITSGTYAANGQTHTIEDMPNPWWELDLGGEVAVDALRVWNRTENQGQFLQRLDGFVLSVFDAQRRVVYQSAPTPAPNPSVTLDVTPPELAVRRAAIGALASLDTRLDETLGALLARFEDPRVRLATVGALRSLMEREWPAGTREALAASLARVFASGGEGDFEGPEGRELLAFADELVPTLPREDALALYSVRRTRGPQVILLRPVRDALQYDRKEFTVQAGRPVEVVFHNVDLMPHNFVVAVPGSLAVVGQAGEAMAADPNATSKGFVPEIPEILWHTNLLQPGQRETLRFVAPSEPADHPYVCTFPGHWVRMNGVMHVVDELPAATLLPGEEVTAAPAAPAREFVRDWKVADLRAHLARVDAAAAPRGREVLEAATCLVCHKVGDEGGRTGPPLADVVGKYAREELLTQIVEPSKSILEGYESEVFLTTDGLIVAGRVVDQDAENLYVLDDPYQEGELVLPRAEVDSRRVSDVSTMPAGLLNTFQRDEILALLAYLESLAPAAPVDK
ncbi:MAG: c-type cytochrome [Planctomycetes bacterium]|nr:c-type cytochrome [Planctomycetota bacterium]